jgi:predicted lipoprotein with Yx(FWY)xxD motif
MALRPHPPTPTAPAPAPRPHLPTRSRRLVVIGGLLAVGIGAGACGSSATSTTTSPGSTTAAPAGGGGGAVVVKSAQVGSVGTVLVNAKGRTLYHYTPDTATKVACVGGCATLWPPLLVPAGTTSPTGASGLTGFGTVARTGGELQVTYHGMPLYIYSGDSSAGQANGQGLGGVWHVITVSSTGGSMTTTTAASHGGY